MSAFAQYLRTYIFADHTGLGYLAEAVAEATPLCTKTYLRLINWVILRSVLRRRGLAFIFVFTLGSRDGFDFSLFFVQEFQNL